MTSEAGIRPEPAGQGSPARPVARIVGGRQTDSYKYPFLVSLLKVEELPRLDKAHFCGGSLIAKDKVLTAAHCFAKQGGTKWPQLFRALVHGHDLTPAGARHECTQVVPISSIECHARYDDTTLANDICLVTIGEHLCGDALGDAGAYAVLDAPRGTLATTGMLATVAARHRGCSLARACMAEGRDR